MSKNSYFLGFPFSLPGICNLSGEVNSIKQRDLFYAELPFYYGNKI